MDSVINNIGNGVLRPEERTMLELRALYRSFGYRQFKVSRFESYDLYMQNKNFLKSGQVIAFTDSDGSLTALKPDVTLSIVKNTGDDGVTRKLYYNESVYRVPRGGGGFREIQQTGLECIGNVDIYAAGEVIKLAAESLAIIGGDYVLDISNLGIIAGVLENAGIRDEAARSVLGAFGGKSEAALNDASAEYAIPEGTRILLKKLLFLSGPFSETLDELMNIGLPAECAGAVNELCGIAKLLGEWKTAGVRLDFSVVNDMDYYSGIVFKGFVKGIPASVLSGGRYDSLMERMGKHSGAIGFAVYLDEIERFSPCRNDYETDALVIYDDTTDTALLARTVDELRRDGKTVFAGQTVPPDIRCRETLVLSAETNGD